MLETKVVQVTGRGSNVNLDIDDSTPIDGVVQGLRNHLLANRLMYSRGTITVNVGRRMLDREELTRIKELIGQESGVTVSRFWCPPNVLEEAISRDMGFGVAISPREERVRKEPPTSEPHGPAGLELWAPYIMEVSRRVEEARPSVPGDAVAIAEQKMEEPPGGPVAADTVVAAEAARAVPGPDAEDKTRGEAVRRAEVAPVKRIVVERELSGLNRGNEALLIKTHCRSGEVIRYPGDVVVMADVNPGSEIIADGDILVFGSLRGFAHAGASGDIQATIIAQNFETPRLQIGPHVGVDPRPGKRSRSNSANARIAFVRRRSVFVAPYTGRFGEYSGGTLYDG